MTDILPKIVFTDIDGVWTDGGMYYDSAHNELKKFNTSDSAGVVFLRIHQIPTVIITGEDTDIVRRRAKKLNIEHVFCGVRNKVAVAEELLQKMTIDFSHAAFIGDDLNDVPLLKKVRWSAAPANAPDYIKDVVQLKLSKSGGEGAFRQFVEIMLTNAGLLQSTIDSFLQNLEKPT